MQALKIQDKNKLSTSGEEFTTSSIIYLLNNNYLLICCSTYPKEVYFFTRFITKQIRDRDITEKLVVLI